MKPFLSGKKASAAEPLRSPHRHVPLRTEGSVRSAGSGPSVEVVKEGDKVVRLIVSCSCGEKIEIDCLYPANG
ncbi:MAG: hypothetical protein Q8J74_03935 [Candidatus Didemnitutus sp.]|nr:hypothetical protein [Candidatus Didemnitutus sp.]